MVTEVDEAGRERRGTAADVHDRVVGGEAEVVDELERDARYGLVPSGVLDRPPRPDRLPVLACAHRSTMLTVVVQPGKRSGTDGPA